MRHSTGKPTKAQAQRFEAIKRLGCLCCRIRHFQSFTPEIHHLLSGNRRRGHDYTIGLCAYHHRGIAERWSPELTRELLGPSLARSSKRFHDEFGTDDELLAKQNQLIGEPR